jgi:hypothetical protein
LPVNIEFQRFLFLLIDGFMRLLQAMPSNMTEIGGQKHIDEKIG